MKRGTRSGLACLTCGKTNTRNHCRDDHPQYTWIVCRVCSSYGDPMRSDRWRHSR